MFYHMLFLLLIYPQF